MSAASRVVRLRTTALPAAVRGDAAGLLAGALAISWLAALAWWWLLPASRTVELTISEGTSALVLAGEVPPDLPRELVLRVGDTLAIRNLDAVAHRVGPLWVAPATVERSTVGPAFFAGAKLTCTIHPAGALAVLPRARPSVASTVPVALLAAIPLGFAALVALAIARRLDGTRGMAEPERAAPPREIPSG